MSTATQSGTDLERWQAAYADLAPEVRERWALEQVKTIRNTVARDLTPAEFQMGLAIAAKYDLDPLLREIWFTKGNAKNGQPGRVMIMVGRDGLLRNARRDTDYEGFDTDVVHANDHFEVTRLPNGERQIVHSYGLPAERGAIVGAWAIVKQRDKIPTYFFAPMDEYMPRSDRHSPWKVQPSVMIQKCALSLALRLAFNLSGVVGEDEGARMVEDDYDASAPVEVEALRDLVPDGLWSEFEEAWEAAVAAQPGRFSVATAQMVLGGQPSDAVIAYIQTLRDAADEAAPPDADVVLDESQLHGVDERAIATEAPGVAIGRSDVPVPEEERPAAPAQEDPGADVEALRRRLSDLYDRVAAAEANPNDDSGAEYEALYAEVTQVEEALIEAGGHIPGQETLLG